MTLSMLNTLGYEEVSNLYNYDPDTGTVTRKKSDKIFKAGDIVKSRVVTIKGMKIGIGRFVWFLLTGDWVNQRVHFIDGDKENFKAGNLRLTRCVDRTITQQRVRELLYYNSETGILLWKVDLNSRVKAGDVAGSTVNPKNGYKDIYIDGIFYRTHRVIWLLVYGYFPENDLDHINRVRDDNRLCNLREVSRSCNVRNSSLSKNNRSGVIGVSFDRKRAKWRSNIQTGSKWRQLYWGLDLTEAVAHRYAAEQCLNWGDCDTKSSAREYLIKEKIICPA